MPPKLPPRVEYKREQFTEWTQNTGVHEIQRQYDQIRKEAKANDRSIQEEMEAKGFKTLEDFSKSCPRFPLTCWPSQFGELGSGYVLYFHMLSLMMALFAMLFLMQIYPMAIYSKSDFISGWQFTEWMELYSFDSSKACECVGMNNGMVGPGNVADYGKTCNNWDEANCNSTGCSFTNPGKWVCGRWCFAKKGCPAPLLEGDNLWMSNRVQAPDDSKVPWDDGYQGLVRSYSSCQQDSTELATCTALNLVTNLNKAYGEALSTQTIGFHDAGESNYPVAHEWLSPANTGPDQLENVAITWVYFMAQLVLCACVFLAYQFMIVTDTKLDTDLVLPNDFAVMFDGLPISATDEKELKEWFSENAIPNKKADVVKVVIGWNPEQFAEKMKQLKALKQELDDLEVQGGGGLKSYFTCCFPSSDDPKDDKEMEEMKTSLKQQMAEINKTLISAGSTGTITSSGVVVVIFRYQDDMRRCVRRWNSFYQRFFYLDGVDTVLLPSGNQIWPGQPLPKYPIGDRPVYKLSAIRAPNPGDIHWEELGVDRNTRWKKLAQTNSVMLLIIAVCVSITWGLEVAQDAISNSDQSGAGFSVLQILSGLGIGMTNAFITVQATKQGEYEYHSTKTVENFSQMMKMAFGMLANTGLALYLVNSQPFEWYKAGGLINDASTKLIITCVLPSLIPLVDIGWRFKARKRLKLTDERIQEWNDITNRSPDDPRGPPSVEEYTRVRREAEVFKNAFTPSEMRTTRRFAVALKTFMICVLYMPLSPFVALVGFFGIASQYWIDKYVLLTWAKRPTRPIGRELPLLSLKIIKYFLPLAFAVTVWMFLTPSFKEKSLAWENFWAMLIVASMYALLLPFNVWTKPFLRCFFDQSKEAMDYYQAQHGWTKEQKYHKDQFIYKKLPETVNPEILRPDTVTVKVDAVKESWGAAVTAAGKAATDAPESMIGKGGMAFGAPDRPSSTVEESPESKAEEGDAGIPEPDPAVAPAVAPEPLAPVTIGRPEESSEDGADGAAPLMGDGAAVPAFFPPPAAAEEGKGKSKGAKGEKGKADKGKGKGKTKIVWEFKHRDHFTPFQDKCQNFIEQRYQEFKYEKGGPERTVKSDKVTFLIKFSEPMQSKVTSTEGRDWVDVRRVVR